MEICCEFMIENIFFQIATHITKFLISFISGRLQREQQQKTGGRDRAANSTTSGQSSASSATNNNSASISNRSNSPPNSSSSGTSTPPCSTATTTTSSICNTNNVNSNTITTQSSDSGAATLSTTNVLVKEEKKESSIGDTHEGDCVNGVVTSASETGPNVSAGPVSGGGSLASTTTMANSASSTTTTVDATIAAISSASEDTNATVNTLNSGYTPNGIKSEALSAISKATAINTDAANKTILLPNEIKQEKAVENNVTSVVNSVALNANNDDGKLEDIR